MLQTETLSKTLPAVLCSTMPPFQQKHSFFLLHVLRPAAMTVRTRPCPAFSTLEPMNIKPSSCPGFSPRLCCPGFYSTSFLIDEGVPFHHHSLSGEHAQCLDNLSLSEPSGQLAAVDTESETEYYTKTPALELTARLDKADKEGIAVKLILAEATKEENTDNVNLERAGKERITENLSFGKADNDVNANLKEKKSIVEMVEEHGHMIQAMLRHLEECKSMITSVSADVLILKKADSNSPTAYIRPSCPEWEAFINHVNSLGYFTLLDEEVPASVDIFTDPLCLKRVLKKFSLNHMAAISSLPDEHLQALLNLTYTIDTKKCARARRGIRCYLRTRNVGQVGTRSRENGLVDVIQLIWSTAWGTSRRDGLPEEAKTSIRHILRGLIELTDKPLDVKRRLHGEIGEMSNDEGESENELKALKEGAFKAQKGSQSVIREKSGAEEENNLSIDSNCDAVDDVCDDDGSEDNLVGRGSVKKKSLSNLMRTTRPSSYEVHFQKAKSTPRKMRSESLREHSIIDSDDEDDDDDNGRASRLSSQNTFRSRRKAFRRADEIFRPLRRSSQLLSEGGKHLQ